MAAPADEDNKGGCVKKLPSSTVRLIGSTQVITSPLSVVKELLENSLDANSTNIQIKLENFGFDKIEVRDNGSGIKTEDTEFMGQPHYTSKIKSHADLEGLVSYGFRGEALGSLCAVSNVAITTKTADDLIGYTYSLDHKGQIKSKTPSHMGQGTTVIATCLFKDLPVRRQFYNTAKKKKECLKNVEDLVMAFGIIHPEIRLTLHHNKESLWQKSVVANYRMVLLNVLGSACVNFMEYHDYHDEEVDIESYLPRPSSNLQVTGRTNSDRTFIFVNKRPVINKDIEKLLKKYFTAGTNSETSRYPVAFVSLNVTPTGLDVNLDPNKTQVMFHHKVEILEALENLLSDLYGSLEEKMKSKESENVDLENNNDNDKQHQMKPDNLYSSVDEVDCGSRVDLESRNLEEEKYGCGSVVVVSQHCDLGETNTDLEGRFTLRDVTSASVNREREDCLVSKEKDSVTMGEGEDPNSCAYIGNSSNLRSDDGFMHGTVLMPHNAYHSSNNVEIGASDVIFHQRVSGGNLGATVEDKSLYESNVLEDFNEIFEHPLLQDLQAGTTGDRITNQKPGFVFSDLDTNNRPSCGSEERDAARDVSMDFEQQSSFRDQCDILSGGYEKLHKAMGPKGDDLSLLGQRRISAASDSEASWDSMMAVPSENKSGSYTQLHEGDSKLVGGEQIDGAEDMESLSKEGPQGRLSISDIWSKGTGLVDKCGRSVEPVKLLTARPSVSASKSSCAAEAQNRPVKRAVTAELSAGQKTLMESMGKPSTTPNTAFELFVKDHKDIVMADNPDADRFEVKYLLKQEWSELQSPERKQYEDMEYKERERYWQDSLVQQKEKHKKGVEEVSKDSIVRNSGDNMASKSGERVAKPSQKKRKVEKIIIDDSKPEHRDGQTVTFSLDELKAKFSLGFKLTQSQRQEDRPNPIGPLKSLGIWTCCHGNKLLLFNHWRAQEILLYHKMMANHQILCEPMNMTIKLKFDASLIEVLDSLKKKQYFPDTNHFIEDERLIKNGFRVKKVGDTNDYEIVQMTASLITWYDESDLKEILNHIQQSPQATLKECRPLKVINYFKAEAVRMSRHLSSNIGRSEIVDILDQTWDTLPHDTDTCLHGKPITHVLYDLDQLPGTQYTQSTQD
ncbi:PMS1 protein homolog 1-like [Lineus longissimus]|uniref:PMS1 protein homolog 1-like n=1 Tax=Lineus longissimus TaxID=88925 RepID=UPI002B4CCC19